MMSSPSFSMWLSSKYATLSFFCWGQIFMSFGVGGGGENGCDRGGYNG